MPKRKTLLIPMQKGGNIFTDLWSGVKEAANHVKDLGAVSKITKYIPVVGPVVSDAAKMVGLGKRKRKRGRKRGKK